MRIALVTDSTAYLPPEWAAEFGILVVPIHVIVGGVEHREGLDISPGEVAKALREFMPVSTSRPAPGAFRDAYEAAAAQGADGIVSVHISAELSSTIGSAQLAANESPIPVRVVDSRSMGLALGYAVLGAARAAAAGGDLAEVEAVTRDLALGSTVVFYVDTLEYLRRGGRIGAASAMVGSVLAIKPILGLVGGHIEPLEKVRTSARALARLQALAAAAVKASPHGAQVAIQHLDSLERANALAADLAKELGLAEVPVLELGAAVGAHVGPGTLAVAIVPNLA